jgi:hypothetical protein
VTQRRVRIPLLSCEWSAEAAGGAVGAVGGPPPALFRKGESSGLSGAAQLAREPCRPHAMTISIAERPSGLGALPVAAHRPSRSAGRGSLFPSLVARSRGGSVGRAGVVAAGSRTADGGGPPEIRPTVAAVGVGAENGPLRRRCGGEGEGEARSGEAVVEPLPPFDLRAHPREPPAGASPAALDALAAAPGIVPEPQWQGLRRLAWGGAGRRGVARLEIGEGPAAGAEILVEVADREVEVTLSVGGEAPSQELAERIRERLANRGFIVRCRVERHR